MAVVVLTDDSFKKEVLNSPIPVLVDFWAPWCGPCRIQSPLVEELSGQVNGVKVAKLNVDENMATAGRHGVMSIPTLIIFNRGQVVEQMVGVQSKEVLRRKLENLK